MKINFIYSKVYFDNLNRHKPVKQTWEEVKKAGQAFEKKYKKEIESVIKIIPKVTGRTWREKETKVYIVDWAGPCFSHPLTLKVRGDQKLMLVILVHELLHDFFLQSKNIEQLEIKINDLVEQVFKKLKIEINDQIKVLKSYHIKRFKK